jgi:hypothetical protein
MLHIANAQKAAIDYLTASGATAITSAPGTVAWGFRAVPVNQRTWVQVVSTNAVLLHFQLLPSSELDTGIGAVSLRKATLGGTSPPRPTRLRACSSR